MDTRVRLLTLVDYLSYYGENKTLEDAIELIKDIPSLALIKQIASFNMHLYMNEEDPKVQHDLADSLLGVQDNLVKHQFGKIMMGMGEENRLPVIFYRYSNYTFHGLILKNYNNKEDRSLSKEEKLNFFNAYLIINFLFNHEVDVYSSDFTSGIDSGNMSPFIITNFMVQRDFYSNTDFYNQILRGVCLFDFLESHPKYSQILPSFYKQKGALNFMQIAQTVLIALVESGLNSDDLSDRTHTIRIIETQEERPVLETNILDVLSINKHIIDFKDNKILWEKPIYKVNSNEYIILDISFLINQLFKSLVFEFSSFVRMQLGDENFPSIKGKEFFEEIYLNNLIQRCFPHYVHYMGDDLILSNGDELCDVYIRKGNKVALVEFKDVALRDDLKYIRNVKSTIKEIDKKFIKNERGRPKGVNQLVNALEHISVGNIEFDSNARKDIIIYPIIIYTDDAMGMDGINSIYRHRYDNIVKERNIIASTCDLTFINLSYFENHEVGFNKNDLDLFDLLDEYSKHISNSKYAKTPFEIFSNFYLEKVDVPIDFKSDFHQQALKRVIEFRPNESQV